MKVSECGITAIISFSETSNPYFTLISRPQITSGPVKPSDPAEKGEKEDNVHGIQDRMPTTVLIGLHCAKAFYRRLTTLHIKDDVFQHFFINAARHLRASNISSERWYTGAGTLVKKWGGKSSLRYISRSLFRNRPSTWVFKVLKIPQHRI